MAQEPQGILADKKQHRLGVSSVATLVGKHRVRPKVHAKFAVDDAMIMNSSDDSDDGVPSSFPYVIFYLSSHEQSTNSSSYA